MKMRDPYPVLCCVLIFLGLSMLPLNPQESQAAEQKSQTEIQKEKRILAQDFERRRDPFKDLLAEQQAKVDEVITDISQMSVNDVTVIGIVAARNEFTAIINGPRNVPFYVKEGDRFLDGYVLLIKNRQITLRKTKERGFPLKIPKDIVKDINSEAKESV